MKHEFKVGQKVVCIARHYNSVYTGVVGHTYVITNTKDGLSFEGSHPAEGCAYARFAPYVPTECPTCSKRNLNKKIKKADKQLAKLKAKLEFYNEM